MEEERKAELREKIIRIIYNEYLELNIHLNDIERRHHAAHEADQILALYPDIEEAKRETIKEMSEYLKKEYPSITTWQCWQSLEKGEVPR